MFYRKEKQVNELILKHLEEVDNCLKTALKAIEEYLSSNIEEAKSLAIKVDQIETKTDSVRREIIGKLYSGAYLPSLRSDILRLVEHMDKIADGAEACCDFFLDQRPEIPQEMKSNFFKIMERSVSTFVPLKEAIDSFFSNTFDVETIREKTKEVGIIESVVDKEEWDITRDIFKTKLDCGHKLHLKLCLESVVGISDRAEDAADELEIIIIKGGL
jgi:predicted phosphate transport protein (TIGR00153 family)